MQYGKRSKNFCTYAQTCPSRHCALQCSMVNILKFQALVACQNGLGNSADPDQTASLEAVLSGSSLLAILACSL